MTVSKTVLIADNNPTFLRELTQQCGGLGLEVQSVADGLETLMSVLRSAPNLLILDSELRGADGLDVCEKLSQNEPSSAIPVIVLSCRTDDKILDRCISLRADYIHKSLDYWDRLEPLICSLLDLEPKAVEPVDLEPKAAEQAKTEAQEQTSPWVPAPGPKILVIDDDPQITRALLIRLGALGFEVVRSPNAKMGHLLAKTEKPDLIITDYDMPEVTGEQLLINLKAHPSTMGIPVIVLTGHTLNGVEDSALRREMLGRRGAVAYLTKPPDFNKLLKELSRFVQIPSGL